MKIILRIILIICILTIAAITALIVRELMIDRESQSFYSDLASGIARHPRVPGQSREDRTETDKQDEDEDGEEGENGEDGEDDEDEADRWRPYVDFDKLNDTFPGVVGWIKLEGTPIDYPVMQYVDNDHFLRYLPDGTPHRNGSIFLDYRNNNDFSEKSILIYGHETRAGDMFGVLKNFRKNGFFEAHSIAHLHTPENDYTIEIFAGHIAHSIRDHPPLRFENDEDFLNYIEHLKKISVFDSDIEITPEDTIVSLVTCTYDFDNARLIIVGILKPGN